MVRSLIPRSDFAWPLALMEREMGDLMQRFFGPREDWLTKGEIFAPRMNVEETETDYVVTAELPGLKPEDFHLELEDGQLRISGEKKHETEEKGKTYHRVERSYGEFHRTIPLTGAVDADKVTAEYKDGILTVQVPKSEEAKPRKIEIKTQ
jgi:HSP20 family protein